MVPMNSILDRRSILTLSDADGYHPLIYACAVPRPYDDPTGPAWPGPAFVAVRLEKINQRKITGRLVEM